MGSWELTRHAAPCEMAGEAELAAKEQRLPTNTRTAAFPRKSKGPRRLWADIPWAGPAADSMVKLLI